MNAYFFDKTISEPMVRLGSLRVADSPMLTKEITK